MDFNKNVINTFSLLESTMSDNDYSYDIYFRMAVIEKYLEGDESIWDLYFHMQKKRASQINIIPEYMVNHKTEFIELINNIKSNGYNFDYPILVNKNNFIIDGAHRMACCLYFNVVEVPVYVDSKYLDFIPADYSKKWFENNNLNDCISLADIQKMKVSEKIRCSKIKE